MKTMAHFGSRNDKTIMKFTIVDLDNSDVFDLYLNRQITPSIAKKSILHSICLLYPGIFAPAEGFEVPYFLLLPPSLGRS